MKIFTSQKGILAQLKQGKFKLEKDIQNLFEHNLSLLTGYIFIRSEFSIKNSRIDTLAFDPEAKAFVIIEYKIFKLDIIYLLINNIFYICIEFVLNSLKY